jgi:hypothetical protein
LAQPAQHCSASRAAQDHDVQRNGFKGSVNPADDPFIPGERDRISGAGDDVP